jgi:hypothetical protein
MRRFARHARSWVLSALVVVASVSPVFGQEATTDSVRPAPRATTAPRERTNQRIETVRGERARIQREAPPGFARWARELPPAQRRQLDRRLRRMPELQRQRFFREWERLSIHERRELAERLALSGEARRRRELPPRLRTPEMRERLAAMSPEERREFVAHARDWREMKPNERRRMRGRLEKFGTLTADEQQALVDERFKRQSPEERARILSQLRAASQLARGPKGAGEAGTPASRPQAQTPAPDSAPKAFQDDPAPQ